MKKSPKNALEKRNHRKIWFKVHQSILRAIHEGHYAGGFLSLFDDVAMNSLADSLTLAVMKNEDIGICLKRRKPC